jgi:hypothetical protein
MRSGALERGQEVSAGAETLVDGLRRCASPSHHSKHAIWLAETLLRDAGFCSDCIDAHRLYGPTHANKKGARYRYYVL